MRTPKIKVLHKFIDKLNLLSPEKEIIKKLNDTSPIDSNSWLTGFWEADGSFHIKPRDKGKKGFDFRFKLIQSQETFLGFSNSIWIDTIAKFLGVFLLFAKKREICLQFKIFKQRNFKKDFSFLRKEKKNSQSRELEKILVFVSFNTLKIFHFNLLKD